MYDAAQTMFKGFQLIKKSQPHIMEDLLNQTNKYRFLSCNGDIAEKLKYGKEISESMRQVCVLKNGPWW